VIIWDVLTGAQLLRLDCHEGGARCVAWSVDCKCLATGGCDKFLLLWDVETGRQLEVPSAHHNGGINSLVFSSMMDVLISASGDHTIMVWDFLVAKKASLRCTLSGHTQPVLSICLSPDNMYIASASEDKTVRIWEVGTGQLVGRFEGHSDFVNSIAWSRDCKFIVSSSDDQTVRVWGFNLQVDNLCEYAHAYKL
jgi:WD40 repeat protein